MKTAVVGFELTPLLMYCQLPRTVNVQTKPDRYTHVRLAGLSKLDHAWRKSQMFTNKEISCMGNENICRAPNLTAQSITTSSMIYVSDCTEGMDV